jgi:paraquat-inducible protein A
VSLWSKLMSPLYYIASTTIALVLIFSAEAASESHRAASRYETASERADTQLKRAMEWLSLGLYQGASEKVGRARSLNEIAAFHQRRVQWSGWLLLAVSLAFLAAKATQARRFDPGPLRRLVLHLTGVSAVFLLVGIVAPMLTVVAQTEVTFLGEVVFQYESRSIIGTAGHLATRGNLLLALLLFLFSVLIPVIKLLLSFVALGSIEKRAKQRALSCICFIGKWSMTDVFVVAVVLAFLSTESKALTDASLGPGLYFFAGYGLLSMIGGQVLIRLERAKEE